MNRRKFFSLLALSTTLIGCSANDLAATYQQLQEIKTASANSGANSLLLAAGTTQAALYQMAIVLSKVMALESGETGRELQLLTTGDTQFYYDFDLKKSVGTISAFRGDKNVAYLSFLYERSEIDMGEGFLIKSIGGHFEGYQLSFPLLTFRFSGLLDEDGGVLKDAEGNVVFDVRVSASGNVGVGGRLTHRVESTELEFRYPLGDSVTKVGSVRVAQANGVGLVADVILASRSLSLEGELIDPKGQTTHKVTTDSDGKVTLRTLAPQTHDQPTNVVTP